MDDTEDPWIGQWLMLTSTSIAMSGCFKPKEFNTKSYHRDDGWHKNLKCQTSSSTDYVVLSADKYGTPIAIGAGSVSKVVRCNDRSKWVATKGGKEIELRDVFCYVMPKSNN
ncbi:hypothetical protein OESDEN_04399 [Oesophagostomum dentatum]|uniref:Uncharacterized protein n=1 Tax=Oesophagostomum dentatum TaxID=61180 RepID=A0A0B1TEJ6_OESDE|nr:hypothetical protein OESDEN_04399 [Oesophagostomum dentatum]